MSARTSKGSIRSWYRKFWPITLLLITALPVWSDTVIEGTVTDILGQRVSGAHITISHQGQQIQAGVTDLMGIFSLGIDFGDAGDLNLVIEHPDYNPAPLQVYIVDFEPTEDNYTITLVQTKLSSCIGIPGSVVVGKFLPPASSPGIDLTGHVHRVLSFRILTGLQSQQLRDQLDIDKRHLVPEFLRCDGAIPITESQGKVMARALGGHVLVWGVVANANQGFDIEASIADAGEVFDTPFITTSPDVDLNHPREAAISKMARTAILIGVMANLENAKQCRAVVHVSNLVRTLTPDTLQGNAQESDWQLLVSADEKIRTRCQQSLPEAGLVER